MSNGTANAALEARLVALEALLKTTQDNHQEALDTMWMMLASLLVFFMHAGFSLLEAGCVRVKNAQHILAKNLMVACLGFLSWYSVGYALAFGVDDEDPNKISGGNSFFMKGFYQDKTKFRVWFFQGAFCATAGTIVSGAMAERTQLRGFSIYTIAMTSVVYPLVVYWCWSGHGFMSFTENGESKSIVGSSYMDFAGSGVVHLVGGIGALVGTIFVGPRKDRWDSNISDEFAGHSIPFCVLGTFCLWFGWFGFNAGSSGSLHDVETAHVVGLVAVNSTLAPCVSGLLVFVLRAKFIEPKLLDVGGFCNGILAGLVAITAGCSTVEPWESLIIGGVGGIIYQAASMWLLRLKVDDVVDAFAVHGANGLWGILALGLFGNPDEGMGGNGSFYGGDQFVVQIFAAFIILVWVGLISLGMFLTLRLAGMLRSSDSLQDVGADIAEHSPQKAYTSCVDTLESPSKPYQKTNGHCDSTIPPTKSADV